MSVLITNQGILFGVIPDKPALPEGWKYIEVEGEWLLAESPDGTTYFVTKDTLWRRREKSDGRSYIDHRGSILL